MAVGVKLDDIRLLWAWLNIGHRPQASQYSLTSSGSQTCWADSVVCCCSYSGPVDNKLQLYSRIQETESDWAEMSLDCGNRHQQTSPEIMLKIHLWLSLTWWVIHMVQVTHTRIWYMNLNAGRDPVCGLRCCETCHLSGMLISDYQTIWYHNTATIW